MPEIKGFRGLVYNRKKIESFDEVLCPPYDVIPSEMQDDLYLKSPYNAIRLELPKEEDRYEAAAVRFQDWQAVNILVRDEKEAIYPYNQTFTTKEGKTYTRKGLIAACKLYEFSEGKVLPHEKTLSGPKVDRLNLFKKTEANFSCIFGLYADPQKTVDSLIGAHTEKCPPIIDAMDYQNCRNLMWRIDDPKVISKVKAAMLDKRILIADGHHRYETGVAYRDLRKEANPNHTGNEAYNFIMMYVANMYDEGLVIFPTHRLVHSLPDFNFDLFAQKLEAHFKLTPLDNKDAAKAFLKAHPHSAFVLAGREAMLGLMLASDVQKVIPEAISPALKQLDVVLLHQAILGNLLGISLEAQAKQTNLMYSKDFDEVFEKVASRKAQAGFLMNPTKIEEVTEVAESGEVMPQKSTFFYPKLLTGVVFNSLA
jgi:uncharacterized protein (DUF1015 family)